MQQYVDRFEQVPVVVLVCLERYRAPSPYEGASVYPACQNLLLAARALGYGGALTMWHLGVETELRTLLDIPATWRCRPASRSVFPKDGTARCSASRSPTSCSTTPGDARPTGSRPTRSRVPSCRSSPESIHPPSRPRSRSAISTRARSPRRVPPGIRRSPRRAASRTRVPGGTPSNSPGTRPSANSPAGSDPARSWRSASAGNNTEWSHSTPTIARSTRRSCGTTPNQRRTPAG